MKSLTRDRTLKAIESIDDFGEKDQFFDLDMSIPWCKEIIDSLEKDLVLAESTIDSKFSAKLAIRYRNAAPYGGHLLVSGEVDVRVNAHCVRCLVPCPQSESFDFKAIFIAQHFEKMPEYEELIEVFTAGQVWELYFHHKGKVNLEDLIREQLVIHLDDLPLHHPKCMGLCVECGVDLNQESCPHHRPLLNSET